MRLVIGFTGTREGLTAAQMKALADLILSLPDDVEFHHGGCIGSDAMAHWQAKMRGWRVVLHPATVALRWRADIHDADEIRPEKPPLARNEDIVRETTQLFACPAGRVEERRSGTWQTIRCARRYQRTIWYIWPDGMVEAGRHDPEAKA
jgi:hypothetical protein